MFTCDYSRLLTNYFIDIGYDVNKYTLGSLVESLIKTNKTDFLKMLYLYDSELITVNDVLFDDIEYKDYLRYIPDEIVTNLTSNKCTGLKIKDLQSKIYKNQAQVFYYDNLDAICKNIPMKDLSCLPFTIRLYIPKLYIDIINAVNDKGIIYSKPLRYRDKILFEEFNDVPQDMIDVYKDTCKNLKDIYLKTGNEVYLPNNTIYEVLTTQTIRQWGTIINTTYKYDKFSSHPSLTYIPYYLRYYQPIYKVLHEFVNNEVYSRWEAIK